MARAGFYLWLACVARLSNYIWGLAIQRAPFALAEREIEMANYNVSYVYEGTTESGMQVKVDNGTHENKYDIIRAVINALEIADDSHWTQLNSITITRLNDDGTLYESEREWSQYNQRTY
jgi:hypothetical protein